MILDIRDLKSWYEDEKYILQGINMKVDEGKIFALLGPNGAGKTTLLSTISSIHNKYSGNIYYCGERLTGSNQINIKKRRYFIPDHPQLFDEMTPFSFMEFTHGLYGKRLNVCRLEELSEKFDFTKNIHKVIGTLSLGNRQKVSIINGLLLNCPLLIMDEPLTGLDVVSIEVFYNEMKEYKASGNSVLLSTHLFEIVENVCDQAFILHKGTIRDDIKLSNNKKIKEIFFQEIGYGE